jgi:hypothetical protein
MIASGDPMPRPHALAAASVAVLALAGCGVHNHDRNLTFDHGLRAFPNPPTTIDKLTLSFDVINDGPDGLDNVGWRIDRDGAPFLNGTFAHIDAHDFEFSQAVFTEAVSGDHVYTYIIDPNNAIAEWDENDNVSVIKVTVPPGGTG